MVRLLRTLRGGLIYRGVFVALFVALSVTLVSPPPKAMAGGAIMIGSSVVINGKDRVTGKQYNPTPGYIFAQRLAPTPTVVRVYQGDWVQFMGVFPNIDPFPIPGIASLQMHYKGFNDPLDPLNPVQYFGRHVVDQKMVFTIGTGIGVIPGISNFILQPPPVQMVGPGSDTPGKQYCQFASTNPTFYLGFVPIIFYFEWKIPSVLDLRIPGTDITIPFGRTMSCAEIAYVYNLVPSVTIDGNTVSTVVTQGERLPNQKDAPGFTVSKKTQWQVSQFYLSTNQKPSDKMTTYDGSLFFGLNTVCNYLERQYKAKKNSCKVVAKNRPSGLLDPNDTIFNPDGSFKSGSSLPDNLSVPNNIPAGYKVCYSLSVRSYAPYLEDALRPLGIWRNSKVECTGGSKKPKIQILGDDVRAGGKIVTSLTSVQDQNKTFGSWGEYASYSGDDTIGFGSASGLKGGVSLTDTQFTWSRLTFANTRDPYGHFFDTHNSLRSAKEVGDYFRQYADTHGTVDNLTVRHDLPDDDSLNPVGKSKTIIVIGDTIKIKHDITYTSENLRSLDDIPQVVIVAKNIVIDEGVKRIDAWLVADDSIDTCQLNGRNLTMNICNEQLKINGPVVTNHMWLNRTYGSDGDSPEEPAEIFNNNGTAYLWAKNLFRSGTNSLISTYQTDLPPRL